MFLYFVTMAGDKVMGKHARKKADMSGDQWRDEDDVMLFIYTLVLAFSLASKRKKPKLLAIHPRCHSVPYFHSIE